MKKSWKNKASKEEITIKKPWSSKKKKGSTKSKGKNLWLTDYSDLKGWGNIIITIN